jgi:hypothetical protein
MLSRRSWRSSLIGAPTEPIENKVEGSVGPAVRHLPSIRSQKKARLIQPDPSSTRSWGHYLQFMSLQAQFLSYNR